jgi:hypothetical protein
MKQTIAGEDLTAKIAKDSQRNGKYAVKRQL